MFRNDFGVTNFIGYLLFFDLQIAMFGQFLNSTLQLLTILCSQIKFDRPNLLVLFSRHLVIASV